jgi:PAS domain S-box-containing protein
VSFGEHEQPDRPWVRAEELPALQQLWAMIESQGAAGMALVQRTLAQLGALSSASAEVLPHPGPDALRAALQSALLVDIAPLARQTERAGAALAHARANLHDVHEIIAGARRTLVQWTLAKHQKDAHAAEQVLETLLRLSDRAMRSITEQYLQQRERLAGGGQRGADDALLLKRLSESGLLGILVCDIHGGIKDANEAFASMVDYSREELMSGKVRWSEITPPEWAALDSNAVMELQAHGRTQLWEKEYFRKDGSRVPVIVGVAVLSGSDVVAFTLEITERKRSEQLRARSIELETENRRVQEASRLKSEFLANMSHELRTPLNSIIGFADLLYDGEVTPGTPEHREYLGDILKSGRHLLQLINDVLDLAKIESGKMEFRPERVDLPRVIREVLDVLRSIASENQIHIGCEVSPLVDELVTDPARLKQVLYNYLSNALKFTPSGGQVTVRVLGPSDTWVTIEVEDSGTGIAEADLSRLFIEFEQLDHGSAKKYAGTGLGLALTKRIVEAQGGSVGVRSQEGKGSTFWATLPMHALPSAEPMVSTPPPHGNAALILVVEDDIADQRLIVETLHGAGYDVQVVATGKEAAELCAQRHFDAVTLDLLLPDLSGLQVLRELRNEGLNRDTPVIVVSVVAERQVVQGFAVHDYIAKPVESSKLLESLLRAGVTPDKPGTVLVIDDDPSSLKLMSATLRKQGYAVDSQADAAVALERTRTQHPSAVILDLLMPGMDGFEFLWRFRERASYRDVPVIIWTTKDLSTDDRRRLHRQAQAVFEKGGGRPLLLVEELSNLLHQRAAERATPP